MKVGFTGDRYPDLRNIVGKVPETDYVKVFNVSRLMAKLFNENSKALRNIPFVGYHPLIKEFNELKLNRVDILHLFNTISFGKTPWITTFENSVPNHSRLWNKLDDRLKQSYLPQMENQILEGLKVLSNDSCKKLIALSKCNLNMQLDFLQQYPQYRSKIEQKLTQLHPPQRMLVDSFDSKRVVLDGPVHFMFVGRGFFQKGGMETLEAFQELRKHGGYDLKLTIVSSLVPNDYTAKGKEEDARIARTVIQENGDWIDHFDFVPNQKVLELMKSAHVGLLPTYLDTYGYSVLEFQASGCPVISTNGRALPEINNSTIGWMIEVQKDDLGEPILVTEEEIAELSTSIKNGLTSTIVQIMEDRQLVPAKAAAALAHIRDQHSPEQYGIRLGEIYRQALI